MASPMLGNGKEFMKFSGADSIGKTVEGGEDLFQAIQAFSHLVVTWTNNTLALVDIQGEIITCII